MDLGTCKLMNIRIYVYIYLHIYPHIYIYSAIDKLLIVQLVLYSAMQIVKGCTKWDLFVEMFTSSSSSTL